GRYTRQKIRDLALNRAGNRALDADAADFLAQHLFELYTLADWPFLYVSAPLTLAGPTVTLPADFVTATDDHGFQIVAIDGSPQASLFAMELWPEGLARIAPPGGSSAGGVPLYWAVSRSDTTARVAPAPTGRRIDVVLRYKRLPSEPLPADEPADIPAFPSHNSLVQAGYVLPLAPQPQSPAPSQA